MCNKCDLKIASRMTNFMFCGNIFSYFFTASHKLIINKHLLHTNTYYMPFEYVVCIAKIFTNVEFFKWYFLYDYYQVIC